MPNTLEYLERIAYLQTMLCRCKADMEDWKDMVGAVSATIPAGEITAACFDKASLVKYFKDLHAERDALKKLVGLGGRFTDD